jgi:glycosyltransferase involved in cell wall biosynthesis
VVHDTRDLDLHSTGFARLPGPWRTLLASRERAWVRSADAVIAASEPYAEVLGQAWGRAPTVIWNGPSAIVPPSERGRQWHDQLGLPPDRRVVLYLGLAIPGRGIEELCRAMADVPAATLVVAGFGPEYERYRASAAVLPHADRIAFTGPVRSDAILGATAAADVAAMPVQGDTLNHRLNTPTKLFDAMGAGTPVVAGDLPGMAAIVRAAGCGELCDSDDPTDIARALRLILDAGPERRAAYQVACLAAAREVFAWERQAVTYLDLYAGLPWPARSSR